MITDAYRKIRNVPYVPPPAWIQKQPWGYQSWTGMTQSENGLNYALTSDTPNGLYTTSNAGDTWTQHAPLANAHFGAIAGSADGQRLIAGVGPMNPGNLYVSTNGGTTWTVQTSALGSKTFRWLYTPRGGDCSRLITSGNQDGASSDYLFVSNNFGVTWAGLSSGGVKQFIQPIISADGQIIYTAVYNSYAYRSANGGTTWQQQGIARGRTCLNGSATLKYIIQGLDTGDLLYSTDYGVSWINFKPQLGGVSREWRGVSVSEDGAVIIAAAANDSIWMSINAGATWTQQFPDPYATGYYIVSLTGDGKHAAVPLFSSYFCILTLP